MASENPRQIKKIAFYGGSFDPVHNGHLAIAAKLTQIFTFDEFYFVPAFHAPHKKGKRVSPAFCRYAMLALATQNEPKIKISTVELDAPEKPYTVETLAQLKNHYGDTAEIFFVMGADSWNEITTWREWEKLLTLTNFAVVTRPDFPIETAHVTPEIRERIADLRNRQSSVVSRQSQKHDERRTTDDGQRTIFITDAVLLDISATEIRQAISLQNGADWRKLVAEPVAEYIEKYELYR